MVMKLKDDPEKLLKSYSTHYRKPSICLTSLLCFVHMLFRVLSNVHTVVALW